jgi:hypothetical protein
VAQAPAIPARDTFGGLEHSGWHLGYFDDASQQWQLDTRTDTLTQAGGLLHRCLFTHAGRTAMTVPSLRATRT